MQANSEQTSQFVAKRTSWNEARIKQALVTLKTHNLRATAIKLDVSLNSLRHALSREGVSIRAYRKLAKGRKQLAHGHSRASAFVSPEIGGEERPFLAMAAFEDRPHNGCSWPIGDLDKGAFKFCDKPRVSKKPYCSECLKRAYEAAEPLDMKLYSLYK